MMKFETILPNRYFKLILEDGRDKKNKVLSYLDINSKVVFNISQSVSGALSEANITIYGINVDKMSFLATSCSNWLNNTIKNKITIIAGYENKPFQLYSGVILEAVPSFSNADFNIQLKCVNSYDQMIDNVVNYSFIGEQPLKNILQKIANDLNYNLVYNLENSYTLTDYTYSNTSYINHLRNIANQLKIDCYIDGSRIIAKEIGKRVNIYNDITLGIDNIIGDIMPNNLGCEVYVKLNGSLQTGQRVLLKSTRFPQLNNQYYIIQLIGHEGDTRGQTWRSKLTLIKEGIYDNQ